MRYGVFLPCDAMALMVTDSRYWLFFETTKKWATVRTKAVAFAGTGLLP